VRVEAIALFDMDLSTVPTVGMRVCFGILTRGILLDVRIEAVALDVNHVSKIGLLDRGTLLGLGVIDSLLALQEGRLVVVRIVVIVVRLVIVVRVGVLVVI
jgi:hypothetical protein